MRPDGPTSWLLDGGAGWRTAHADGVVAAPRGGIRLAAAAGGPRALDSEGGTLGGLRPPPVLTVAGGETYLLARSRREVLRYDPRREAFAALPTLGGDAAGVRALRDPAAIAVVGRTLYVADPGARRVLVIALASLALRAVLGPWDAVSLAVGHGSVFVLDRAAGSVWRHHPARSRPELVLVRPDAQGRWSNLAVDRDGRLYLHDDGAGRLDVFDALGCAQAPVTDPDAVRERFTPPPMLLQGGRFCLPAGLRRDCDRRSGDPAPALLGCDAVFDVEGRPATVDPADRGPQVWQRAGTWLSEPLDSEIASCQWHRVELELGGLPTGASLELRTYADDERLTLDEVRTLPDGVWETRRVLTGALQPGGAEPAGDEFLIQSRPGRYLWLHVALRADGYATPSISSLRVQYPRASYLDFLPEVFAAEDETHWFLERFLSIAQTEWDDIRRRGDELPASFDPDTVPAGAALERLAGWLGLPPEGTWDDAANRRLLGGVPASAARRGTLDAVRGFLRLYLDGLRGEDTAGYEGYPCIVEGFRERARLLLSTGAPAALDHGAPLWSRDVVGRLQLGVHSRSGHARLVSTGDPQRDLFHEHGHRFSVYVPAAWVRTADDERMLRRALDAEKPAHTRYDLCLVEPRLRVGIQCTVGVDTIVAAVPVWRLACEETTSRGPRGRLGYDTVLGGAREDGLRVGGSDHIGTYQPLI